MASPFTHALGVLQDFAANAMVDTVKIDRTDGLGTYNTTTGLYENPTTTPVYPAGQAIVRRASKAVKSLNFGQHTVTANSYIIGLPHTAGGALRGDVATVVASQEEPQLVGKQLHVEGELADSHNALRWVLATDLQDPAALP